MHLRDLYTDRGASLFWLDHQIRWMRSDLNDWTSALVEIHLRSIFLSNNRARTTSSHHNYNLKISSSPWRLRDVCSYLLYLAIISGIWDNNQLSCALIAFAIVRALWSSPCTRKYDLLPPMRLIDLDNYMYKFSNIANK